MASEPLRSLVALGLLVFTTGARVYMTEEEALRIAFPEASRIEARRFELGEAARVELSSALGYRIRERSVVLHEAMNGDALLGHGIFMREVGKRLPMTFFVAIGPGGSVDQVLLLEFREPRGYEVEAEAFRRQYRGRTVRDPIRRGRDIRNVSGATMSVDAMSRGVRRALVLYDHLLRPTRRGTESASTAAGGSAE